MKTECINKCNVTLETLIAMLGFGAKHLYLLHLQLASRTAENTERKRRRCSLQAIYTDKLEVFSNFPMTEAIKIV